MSQNIHDVLLSSLCESMRNVIPRPIDQSEAEADANPATVNEMGVSISFANPISVKMIIDGERQMFSKMSEVLFGMPMEGEMLDSCVGEIANIIAGGTTTLLSNHGIAADITPPSLLTERATINGYENGLALNIEEVGNMRIMLLGGN
ncbi:chemotaxis protein CheX [Cohnella yongneupensis]|uniref:Chemotaxis protein CheX n=1 Tax=Cohnella yongneupensis TaxID=425006 RepID=A0ABW0R285_9BACL